MMLSQLKKIFSSLILYPPKHQASALDYQWFMTGDNQIVGIENNELTDKDTLILTALLEPYHPSFPLKTHREQKWSDIINEVNIPAEQPENPYRFVYFNVSANQIAPHVFKDAINELFAREVAILWENEKEGIIIEEIGNEEETISYDQIIDILMSDLYVKINVYVGPFQSDFQTAPSYYHHMIQGGHVACQFSDKNVVTFMEAAPFILMDQAVPEFKIHLSEQVLRDFASDKEFIKTIDMFLQCNLNMSVAAKKLYMHRNSLQYRLDRFREHTGIDVRNFHEALTVYLALIANRHL